MSLSRLAFLFSYPLILIVSYLPFSILYWVSDFFFFIIYRIIGYRKQVICQNLKNSFPEKEEEEIFHIQKKFYRHFCDLILETVKTLTISPAGLRKRIKFDNPKLFREYFEQGRSVIVVMGHYGNWEYGGARFAQENGLHPLSVLYHPLKNKDFDHLLYRMRTRHGYWLVAMKDSVRQMIRSRKEIAATAFIADQTPPPESAQWIEFLHQSTPVFMGVEKLARKFNYPVIYITVKKTSRGYYEIIPDLLFDQPAATKPMEITKMHFAKLEKDIRWAPEYWLWSHRRWKHQHAKKL